MKTLISKELQEYNLNWVHQTGFLSVDRESLLTLLLLCKENLGFSSLSNISIIHNDSSFTLNYSLQNFDQNLSLSVSFIHSSINKMLSVSGIWPYALSFENEIYELYGLDFDSLKSKQRYLFADYLDGFPFREDFNDFKVTDRVKPDLGREFNETPKFKLCEDDISFHYNVKEAIIEDFTYEMGYKHVGFEKDAIGKAPLAVSSRLGYLNSTSPHFWCYSFCHEIEKSYGIEIPEKAQGARMILSELSRIKEHLYSLLKMTFDLGYYDYVTNLSLWYEKTTTQIRELVQYRNITNYNIIGGVKFDIPYGWTTSCLEYINRLEKELMLEYKQLTRSSFYFEKLQCGGISKREAVNSGVTGPVLRATGYNLDLRKLNPHYFYNDVSFEVPLGLNGKVYDRFLVLNEEIFQSIKILFQVIDNLPAGKFFNEFDSSILNESKSIVGGGIESANGIIYQDISLRDGKVKKLKLGSPGQNSLELLNSLMNNSFYEDKEMIWNSLFINMSEVER